MSGRTRNTERRCKMCGARCEKVMRYCKKCARERKANRAANSASARAIVQMAFEN